MSSLKRPFALFSALLLTILVAAPALAVPPEPGPFERTWERTDRPVAEGVVARTWIWGPEANTPVLEEEYAESPGGTREVQYFDKSRMEINHPDAVDDGLWYVTNGLLVVELMSGMMQVGDDSFVQRSPAEVNIVGDPGYDETPTYADYADLRDHAPFPDGTVIVATVDGDGNIGSDDDLVAWNVTAAEFSPLTNHRTASVFWEFMNSQTTVWEDGQYITDDLFINPYYATGYPITEAYWSRVMLAGSEQWVLTQAFERRVLTYAPNNNEGFQVEAGNVGMHYYQWRYEMDGATINVTTFEFDGETEQGGVLVEAYLIGNDDTCDAIDFGSDEPTASGTTGAESGTFALTDLEAGTYCVGADFDGDGVADDDTSVVTVAAGATVAVSLVNPDAAVEGDLTVRVIGDDDIVVANASVEIYAGTCATVPDDADPLLDEVFTNAQGIAVLDVDGLDAGDYCVVATGAQGVIGQVDVTLPGDTDVTIGGMVGVTVTTTTGANEVQTLTASGATSGTFTLTFDGQTTAPIAYNASNAAIENALESLSNIDPGDIVVTGGPINAADVVVTFTGDLGYTNVPELVADNADLDGVELSITTTVVAEAGVNEVQTLTGNDSPDGTFRLSFGGQITLPIDTDMSAADIQQRLELLPNIESGDIQVTGGPVGEEVVTITFTGELAATNVPPIEVTGANLTSGSVTAATSTQGVPAVNEVQTIAATGATSGTFTLTFDGETTAELPYNASAAQIGAFLNQLSNIAPGDVIVSGGPVHLQPVTIEFAGDYAGEDVDLLTGNDDNLFGAAVEVTTTTQGAPATIQVIYVGSAVTGGTFTLSFDGETTDPIDFDATAAEIEAVLEDLATIDNVSVAGNLGPGASSTITFIEPAAPNQLLTVDDNLIN